MRRRIARGALAALTLTVVAPLSGAAAVDSNPLYFREGKGTFAGPILLQSSGPCPAATKYVNTALFGKGLPAEGALVQGTSTVDFKVDASFPFRFDDNLSNISSDNQVVFQGAYKVVATCWNDDLSKALLTFEGVMKFPGNKTWTASPVWQGDPFDAPPTPGPLGPGGVIPGGTPVPSESAAAPDALPSTAVSGQPVPGASASASAPVTGTDGASPGSVVPGQTTASGTRDTSSSGDWTRWGLILAALTLLGLAAYWSFSGRRGDVSSGSDAGPPNDEARPDTDLTTSGRS